MKRTSGGHRKGGVKWDEENLEENERIKAVRSQPAVPGSLSFSPSSQCGLLPASAALLFPCGFLWLLRMFVWVTQHSQHAACSP